MRQARSAWQSRKSRVLFSVGFAGFLIVQGVDLVRALSSRDYASVPQYICLSALMLLGIGTQLLPIERHPRLAQRLLWVSFGLLPIIFFAALFSILWKP